MSITKKIRLERSGLVLTAFEVIQTILGFGSFVIALIGLCYKIFKK